MPKCKKKSITLLLTLLIIPCFGLMALEPYYFNYRLALVRDLSSSFENSLKLNPPSVPIDLELAKKQHENYIEILERLVPEVKRLEADTLHPDCNFIEDTAIFINDVAVISRMGALERMGEELPVAEKFKELGIETIALQFPATMDGGDILFTGNYLFVGISHRTNEYALEQLRQIFNNDIKVFGIPVHEGLHLKSLISLFDSETLIVSNAPGGKAIQNVIENLAPSVHSFVSLPDSIASNILRIGSSIVMQEGFPASELILENLCECKNVNFIKVNMSELIKADGALTCGSLLIY